MKNIAINGFGRIGKNFLRTLFIDENARDSLNPVVINVGPGSIDHVAYTFKFDTILGTYDGDVSMDGDHLVIDGHKIAVIAECDASKLDWSNYNVEWVVDCSGCYTKREQAQQHITAGAQKVLISAPSADADVTIIPGVNDQAYSGQDVVSLGSCTTNALVPMLYEIDNAFSIKDGIFTTIHSYTNSQVLLDIEKKKYRDSRAAALNTIPTSTGASKTLGKILPHLADKVIGSAVRVPTAVGSLVEVTFTAEKPLSVESINNMFVDVAARDSSVIAVTVDPLVSSDICGADFSAVVDLPLTSVQGHLGKISGWYDNEWGYSMRLRDFLINAS